MIVLYALWAFAAAWAAPVYVEANPEFSADACEALLGSGKGTYSADAGAELCTWLTGTHPLLTEAIDGCADARELFSLFYLQRGFAMPPRLRRGRPTVSQKHFEEVVSFSGEQGHAALRARAVGGSDAFAAEVVENLAVWLAALADPVHEVPGVTANGYLNIHLDQVLRDDDGAEKRVHALFAQSFTGERRNELKRLAEALHQPTVRAHAYSFLKTKLKALIESNDRTLAALNGGAALAALKREIRRAADDLNHTLSLQPQPPSAAAFNLRDTEDFLAQAPPTADAVARDLEMVAEHLRGIAAEVAAARDLALLHRAEVLAYRLQKHLHAHDAGPAILTAVRDLHVAIAERAELVRARMAGSNQALASSRP